MAYRTIKIEWLPKSEKQWKAYTGARVEAARLWSWLVERHAEIRQRKSSWPSKAEIQKEIKGLFPGLHSQSAQQTVADFCESITSAETLRKNGKSYTYPHVKPRYRQVIFTNQGARVRDKTLLLPCGVNGTLEIKIPTRVELCGRMLEVRLNYGSVEIVSKVDEVKLTDGPTIGIDIGINTLLAATDGDKAVLVSGREVKAATQLRNKLCAEINSKQSAKTKGSRRYKKLQRRKMRVLTKTANKIHDLCHKATRKIADSFPNAKAYVGKPFNDACQSTNKKQAQMVSVACNRKLIAMLNCKLAIAIEVDEAYTSQTCPSCGSRSKHGRVYRCRCGCKAPRDLVGCLNIRAIGIDGAMRPGIHIPTEIQFAHPSKYPGVNRVDPSDTGQVAREQSREATRRKS